MESRSLRWTFVDAAEVVRLLDQLHDVEGRWPTDDVRRTVTQMRGQEWCSISRADRLLVGAFGRPDLLAQLVVVPGVSPRSHTGRADLPTS